MHALPTIRVEPMITEQSFIFLRHGQTNWNLEGRFQGQTNIALNETGLEQARDAARQLKSHPIDRIVSSPLIRALKTAATVAEAAGLPVYVDSQLKERSFGAFDGLVVADVKAEHGMPLSEPAARIFPPDAEKWPQTLERTERAIGRWLSEHPDETILFVAHDGLFRALAEILYKAPLESKHGKPYTFEPAKDRWRVSEL